METSETVKIKKFSFLNGFLIDRPILVDREMEYKSIDRSVEDLVLFGWETGYSFSNLRDSRNPGPDSSLPHTHIMELENEEAYQVVARFWVQ